MIFLICFRFLKNQHNKKFTLISFYCGDTELDDNNPTVVVEKIHKMFK